MADEESTQKWIGRNRPPRVQITYDLETRGAIQKVELPLVVGILADLAGEKADDIGQLRERKFVEIDRDNFTDVMTSIGPTLTVKVDKAEAQTITFQEIDDFTPDHLVLKVKALREKLEVRRQLIDLLSRVDGNAALNTRLIKVARDKAEREKLQSEVQKALTASGGVETRGQTSDQQPDQQPEQTPGQTSDQQPGQTPDQQPGQTLGQTSDQQPGQTSGQTSDQQPDQQPEEPAGDDGKKKKPGK